MVSSNEKAMLPRIMLRLLGLKSRAQIVRIAFRSQLLQSELLRSAVPKSVRFPTPNRPNKGTEKLQGKAAHPENHSPKSKQFAQTVCANSFCLFSADFKGKRGDILYKLSGSVLRKLCFYLGGCFLGWVSPSENIENIDRIANIDFRTQNCKN